MDEGLDPRRFARLPERTRAAPLAGFLGGVLAGLGAAAVPAWAQEAGESEQASAPAVEVVGRRLSDAYYVDEAQGAKTDLPLLEVPQAVRVMSRQTLDDLGAVRLDEALDFAGGVSRQNNFGGMWDNIAIRGFAGDVNTGMPLLLNGLSANRGFNAPRDTANIERIEFLKGPVASLYGTSEPGGTINLVTKRPLWERAHAIEGYIGSYDFYRTTLDTTGPITDNLAYRLNVAVEDRESFRDFIETRRYLIAPAFTWLVTDSTRLDYTGELLRHRAPFDRGIVAIGTELGPVPRERFLGEPADGDVVVENQTHQLVLEHDFTQQWLGRVALSYKLGELEGFSTEAQSALQPDNRTLRRQRRFREYDSNDISLQTEVVGKFTTGPLRHELLLGAEAFRFELDQLLLRRNPTALAPYAIDVFDPVYGQPQPIPLPNTDTREEQRNLALYVQDAVSVGRWRLLAGLRFDNYDQELTNRLTGVTREQSPSATSPRLGVSYLLSSQWTLFANAGQSFRPNVGVDVSNDSFDPEEGRALEAGVKWERAGGALGGTVALYEIRKKNVLTNDPNNAGFSIAAGEVRSRGVDVDFSGQLTRSWRLNASLSYIDAEVLEDNTLEVGGRLLNIPEWNGSVLLMYEGGLGASGRFGVGGGLTYSSDRLGEARTQAQADAGVPAFELPDYTVAKLVGYWRINPRLNFTLDVDNVFDKTYYTSSFQRTWVAPGAPRTVTFGVQAKF